MLWFKSIAHLIWNWPTSSKKFTIIKELFNNIGYKVNYVSTSRERGAFLTNSGIIDGFILHEYGGIHCGSYCDTLSMSRAVVGHHVKHSLNALAQLFELGAKTAGLEDTKNKRVLTEAEAQRLGEQHTLTE